MRHPVPPWPCPYDVVPRWARTWRGRLRRPRRYEVIDSTMSGSHHVALYTRGIKAHVVVITEPAEDRPVDVDPGAPGARVAEIRDCGRARGTAGFETAVNRYMRFQDVLDIRAT